MINMGCWKNGVWCWGEFGIQLQQQFLAGIRMQQMQDLLFLFIHVTSAMGEVHQRNIEFSSYSSKVGYDCIMEAKVQDNLEEDHCCAFHILWNMPVLDMIKAFGQRVFLNRLTTKDQLKKKAYASRFMKGFVFYVSNRMKIQFIFHLITLCL